MSFRPKLDPGKDPQYGLGSGRRWNDDWGEATHPTLNCETSNMNVVITGGAGFLGQRLAEELCKRGELTGTDGRREEIAKITLLDKAADPALLNDPRIRFVAGDIADPTVVREVIEPDTASIFHLAAVVSGEAEADFDLGMRVNFDATRQLLEVCRSTGQQPRVVFSSTLAVYGGALPEVVDDSTPLSPRTSYGAQKAIGELLLNDYSRRGFVDGRALRLPTITVRPGKPNRAASSFASGIVREPLNGERFTCPVSPQMRLWVLSPLRAIEAIIAMHDLPATFLGDSRVVNAPGLTVSVAEMVESLERVAGSDAVARIDWETDPVIDRIVSGWPATVDFSRARAMGLQGDLDFDSIVRDYVEDLRAGKPES